MDPFGTTAAGPSTPPSGPTTTGAAESHHQEPQPQPQPQPQQQQPEILQTPWAASTTPEERLRVVHGQQLLNVHTYDGQIQPEAAAFVARRTAAQTQPPPEGGGLPSFEEAAGDVLRMFAEDMARGGPGAVEGAPQNHVEQGVQAFRSMQPVFDASNGVNVQDAFRVAWSLCRDDASLRPLFYLQLEDMVATSGFCAQGRSSRPLQLIAALLGSSSPSSAETNAHAAEPPFSAEVKPR